MMLLARVSKYFFLNVSLTVFIASIFPNIPLPYLVTSSFFMLYEILCWISVSLRSIMSPTSIVAPFNAWAFVSLNFCTSSSKYERSSIELALRINTSIRPLASETLSSVHSSAPAILSELNSSRLVTSKSRNCLRIQVWIGKDWALDPDLTIAVWTESFMNFARDSNNLSSINLFSSPNAFNNVTNSLVGLLFAALTTLVPPLDSILTYITLTIFCLRIATSLSTNDHSCPFPSFSVCYSKALISLTALKS